MASEEQENRLNGKEENQSDQTDAKTFGASGDETDARPGGSIGLPFKPAGVQQPPQVPAYSKIDNFNPEYDMTFPKRGYAIIINNVDFKECGMPRREGSDVDAAALKQRFDELGFEIAIARNLSVEKIKSVLNEAQKADHSDRDCFLFTILTHGEEGEVYGTDGKMKINELFEPFKGDNCPLLKKKPKIFIIQACRGVKLDEGAMVKSDARTFVEKKMEVDEADVKIPSEADFLIAYSTVQGYYAWRNSSKGSWFIQALSKELEANGGKLELLNLFTRVCYRVAYEYESNTTNPMMHGKKQMPSITSQLTKQLYLTRKQ